MLFAWLAVTVFKADCLYVFLYSVLVWKWPTEVEMCSFNKYQKVLIYMEGGGGKVTGFTHIS
jgi:hypothetical protein